MENLKKYTLSNGLRVVLIPRPQSLATTVLVLVEAGSKYESKKINGVSHFLEHLCFKGTTKRPSALAISSELESVGAVSNAFTGHEVTGYYSKVQSQKVDTVLDIISDLYLNPIFVATEIEKEKGVIIEEINMRDDDPMQKVGNLFTELLYGDQPAGWRVSGTKENIRLMTRNDIISYRNQHYVADATTVIVSGAFNEKRILSSIKNLFSGISNFKKAPKIKVKERQSGPRALLHHRASDQTHIVLGFRSFSMFDERKYTLNVLGDILGGGMSSRLFQKVREELGAAYYVGAGLESFTDHGFFAVSAGLDNSRAKQVITAILEELKRISSVQVMAEELRRSKNHLSGKLMIGLETSDELAEFYGEQAVFHKKFITPKELVKKIEAVTAKDVLRVAREVIKNKTLNLAMVGPFKDKKEFEHSLKM